MKNRTYLALFISLILVSLQAQAKEQTELKTEKEKQSYAVGVNMAKTLKNSGLNLIWVCYPKVCKMLTRASRWF